VTAAPQSPVEVAWPGRRARVAWPAAGIFLHGRTLLCSRRLFPTVDPARRAHPGEHLAAHALHQL